MALPSFYIDNIDVEASDTCMIRGNTVSNLRAEAKVTGIEVDGFTNVRAKNNKVMRLNSDVESVGFDIRNADDALLIYNVASRCNKGFVFSSITTLNVYNLTAHNCDYDVITDSSGTFRNIAFSAYDDWRNYQSCTGFLSTGPLVSLNIDYLIHFGLGSLYSGGSQSEGVNIWNREILYIDEPNDDLTPDHISELVNSGTDNPLRTGSPCIGGVESEITDEETAERKYQYELIDNSFWDVENPKSLEMTLIRAFQSRILANAEVAEKSVERNTYIKTAESTARFAELYPMYARYANQTKFKKRVADMWFSGQNPAAIQAYQNAIGGYNLFPSYFKRIEDIEDGWIIGESDIDIDNYLLGMEGQKYGIVIDVLGLSTLSQEASAECYDNTMKSVADIAPVRWNLHHEPQPNNYKLFTDLYNSFEQCELSNMIYNDDFNVSPDIVQQDCQLTTPLISTVGIAASGIVYTETGAVSGAGELSTLDRIWSDNITRTMYYRLGETEASMGTWVEVEHPIGEIIPLTSSYIQFRITVENVLRQIDYEFQGLCLRPYSSARVWQEVEEEEEMPYIHFTAGSLSADAGHAPDWGDGILSYPNDGVDHRAACWLYVPAALRTVSPLTLRLIFSAGAIGNAVVEFGIARFNELTELGALANVERTLTFGAPGPLGVDYVLVDINLTDYIASDTTHIYLNIDRDSSVIGDNLAAYLNFHSGRTLEI